MKTHILSPKRFPITDKLKREVKGRAIASLLMFSRDAFLNISCLVLRLKKTGVERDSGYFFSVSLVKAM